MFGKRFQVNWTVQYGVLLAAILVAVVAGCRSTGDSNAPAVVDAGSATASSALANAAMPEGAIPANAKQAAPSYAQNQEVSGQGEVPIKLASAKMASQGALNQSPPAKLVTLRTLSKEDDFQGIVQNAPGTVLLDFYADWCGPCRKQGKVLQGLETFAAANQAQIIKVDVDQHKAIAKQFDVASLPTLVVVKDGKVVHRKVGLTDESRLRAMMQ